MWCVIMDIVIPNSRAGAEVKDASATWGLWKCFYGFTVLLCSEKVKKNVTPARSKAHISSIFDCYTGQNALFIKVCIILHSICDYEV